MLYADRLEPEAAQRPFCLAFAKADFIPEVGVVFCLTILARLLLETTVTPDRELARPRELERTLFAIANLPNLDGISSQNERNYIRFLQKYAKG